jgi:hypothetical protein
MTAKSISKKSTSTPTNLRFSAKDNASDSDDSLSFSDEEYSDSSDESLKSISKRLNLPTKPCSHQEPPQSNAVIISEMFPMRLEEFYERFLSDDTNFFSEVCSASKCTGNPPPPPPLTTYPTSPYLSLPLPTSPYNTPKKKMNRIKQHKCVNLSHNISLLNKTRNVDKNHENRYCNTKVEDI